MIYPYKLIATNNIAYVETLYSRVVAKINTSDLDTCTFIIASHFFKHLNRYLD